MIQKTMILLGLMTFLITGTASAQLFGSDDSSIERVLKEVKKVNSRLIEMRNAQLPGLQANQAEQLQQINQLQNVVSGIQGSLESMIADNTIQMDKMAARVSQSELSIRGEVKAQNAQQKADLSAFKKDVIQTLDQMKQGFARDMETFATANQDNFKTLADKNAQSLAAVELQLNQSNARTDKVIDHLSQVIKQGNDQQSELVAMIGQVKSLEEASGNAVQTGFASIAANNQVVNSNNKTIKQVLANALSQQEATHKQVSSLQAELTKTQSEIESAKKAIGAMKNIMDRKMDAMFKAQDAIHAQGATSEKMMASVDQKLAEVQAMERATNDKFRKLVETSQALANHSDQLSQKVDMASQKVDAGNSEANLANQKMSKLIEILKTIAAQQDKLDQLLSESQGTGQLLKANEEVKEALGDLRRKANVSIARNNEIIKILNSSSGKKAEPASQPEQENPTE